MNNNDGAINFSVGLDNSQLQADAARVSAQLRGIGNTATAEGARMNKALSLDNSRMTAEASALTNQLKGIGNAVVPVNLSVLGLAASLGLAGKAAYDFAREFETAFAEVKTISASARENGDQIKSSILAMTTEIPVGAIDATKALYGIVSAGQDGANAMNVLEVSAKAAIAGVSTTALTSDIITTVINSYKLEASDALSISDKLFKTVEMGKTTMNELGNSFAQVSALASSYGVTLDDILAAYATMTIAGTKTAEATTQIKSAVVLAIKKFGDQAFEGRTLVEVMQKLQDEAKKAGQTFLEYAGEVEAVNGALKLTGSNTAVFNNSLDKIANSAGTTDAALAVMNETFDKQYILLKNKLTVAMGGFGNVLKDIGTTVIPFFNKILDSLNTNLDKMSDKWATDEIEEYKASLKGVNSEEEARTKIIEQIGKLKKEQITLGQEARITDKARPGQLAIGAVDLGIDAAFGGKIKQSMINADLAKGLYESNVKQIASLTKLLDNSAEIRKIAGIKTPAELKAEAQEKSKALEGEKVEAINRENQIVEAMKTATGEKLKLLAEELTAIQKIQEAREKLISDAMFDAKFAGQGKVDNSLMNAKAGLTTTGSPTAVTSQENPLNLAGTEKSIQAYADRINRIVEASQVGGVNLSLKGYVKAFEDLKKAKLELARIKETGDEDGILAAAADVEGLTANVENFGNKLMNVYDQASGYANQAIGLLNALSTTEGDAASSAAKSIGTIMDIAGNAVNSLAKGDYVGAAIGAITGTLTAVFNAEKAHREALRQIMTEKAAQQKEYNDLLLTQNERLKNAVAIFGTDAFGQAIGYAQQADAYKSRSASANNALSSATVKTGSHKTGLFGWGGESAEYTSLLKVYPQLLDGQKNLNRELAISILNNQTLTDSSKNALQSALDYADDYKESLKNLGEYLNSVFGSLGGEMMDAISDNLYSAQDALDEFAESAAGAIETLMKNIAYSLFFADKFRKLSDDVKAVMVNEKFTPEQQAAEQTKILGDFYAGIGADVEAANKFLIDSKSAAAAAGFDLFKKTSIENNNSMAGKLSAALTEDTANELVGLWNRTSIDIRETLIMSRASSNHLLNIAANTLRTADNTEHLSQLSEIKSSLKNIDFAVNKTPSRF